MEKYTCLSAALASTVSTDSVTDNGAGVDMAWGKFGRFGVDVREISSGNIPEAKKKNKGNFKGNNWMNACQSRRSYSHTEIWLEKYCIARKVLGSSEQLILYTYSMLPEHMLSPLHVSHYAASYYTVKMISCV